MRSGTELMSRTASAGESSSCNSTNGNVHTQVDATGPDPGRLRRLRGPAGPERRLLRALRRADAKGAAPGSPRDQGRAPVLPARSRPGDRLHLDLRGPAITHF